MRDPLAHMPFYSILQNALIDLKFTEENYAKFCNTTQYQISLCVIVRVVVCT